MNGHTLLSKEVNGQGRQYFFASPTIIPLLPGPYFFSDIYFSPTLPTQLRVSPEESKTVVLNLGYTFVPPRKMFKNPYAKDRAQTN